tara:strand:- start:1109 stop:1603 length:495 start_codon:yes stop_codon:yes gene_type:complete
MNYLEETLKTKLKEYRDYETQMNILWGGKKRLFKCVDVQLEIKFSKAEMILKESLLKDKTKKKIQMVEMMYRAWDALINKAKENGYDTLDKNHRCYSYGANKVAIICDSDLQLSYLKDKYKNDKDTVLFSMQELFRFIHPDYLEAKETFKKNNIDITFEKVTYG